MWLLRRRDLLLRRFICCSVSAVYMRPVFLARQLCGQQALVTQRAMNGKGTYLLV